MFDDHLNFVAKLLGDLAAIGIVVGALVAVLPKLAALVTFLWYGAQFFDWAVAKWRRWRGMSEHPSIN